ncbi:MAG: ABC transporter transmembrane domain-containing protein, partial [Planctomycetota bacterium]
MKALRRLSKAARVARRLGPHLDGQRRPLALAGALSLGAVALEILRPWPLKWIFDGALVPTGEPAYEASFVIWVGAAAALTIALARTAFQYFATMRLTAVGHSVTRSLRLQLFGHLAELDPGFHAEHKSGDLLVRLMGDVPMVRTMLVESRVTLITRSILAVATVAVMIWLDPLMTVLVLALLPLVFTVVRLLSRSIAVAVRKQRKKEGALADFLQESLLATDVIQSLGGTDQTVRRFARGNRTSARAEMKAARAAARLTAFVESSIGLATAGTLVLGARRVAHGQLTPGELLVFLSYVRSLSKPSRATAKQMIKVAKGTACGERILSIL